MTVRNAWLINSWDMRSRDMWAVCELLRAGGGGTMLANYLTHPDKPIGFPTDRAKLVGQVRIDDEAFEARWKQEKGNIFLTDAEFLALWESIAEPATVAAPPCRWCKGTGMIDISVGRGRLEPCLDCPAGAAHRKGKA